MLPLSDNFPTRTTPLLTWALIAACIAVYLLQLSAGPDEASQQAVVFTWGFIPALTLGGAAPAGPAAANPGWPTILSSMFMHGGWLHLGGNLLYLYIFGDNLEDRLGRLRFLFMYLAAGLAAALTQGLLNPASPIPMVGASGAISGVLGAYLLLYPRQRITVWMPTFGPTRLPALFVLGSWFFYQFLYGVMALGRNAEDGGGVAFWAHVGGFVAGAILIKLLDPGLPADLPPGHPAPAALRLPGARRQPHLWD